MKRLKRENITKIHVDENERGQNTHGQGERVKIPLLPNNVGKKIVNDMTLSKIKPQKAKELHFELVISYIEL